MLLGSSTWSVVSICCANHQDVKKLTKVGCECQKPFSVLQIAQIDLLKAMGLQPDGIVGHSVGELACGYADNSLSHEEAILAAYWRGRCIKEAKLPPGGMAAVGTKPFSSLSIACTSGFRLI